MNNIYKDMMRIVEPDDEFKTKIREKMLSDTKTGVFSPRTGQNKPRLRPLLIAAIIIIVVATTAFAYGYEIWQFIFAEQVENVDNEMQILLYDSDETVTMGVSLINSPIDIEQIKGIYEFSSLDELQQSAAFDVKLPSYLPADKMQFSYNNYINGVMFNEDEKIYGVNISYRFIEIIDSIEEQIYIERFHDIGLNQLYLGAEGHLKVETLSEFQRVMISNSEGIVIQNFKDDPNVVSVLSIYWQSNGVLYILHSYGDILDIDEMIKIAESLF